MNNDHLSIKKTDVDFFETILLAYKSKNPFVAYKKPDDNIISAIVQKNDLLHYSVDYKESGFIFAPFDSAAPSVLLPFSESTKFFCQYEESLIDDHENNSTTISNSNEAKEEHIELVKQGIDFLENNSFKKVVLSRKESTTLGNFKLIETFKKLLTKYKKAFAYCWFHPRVGLWLGATPETLLKVNKKSFSTMALAGTQVYDDNNDVQWHSKEIQEQQYVTEFILKQLRKSEIEQYQELNDFKVSKPYTTKAGNLLHLRTDISGELTKKLTLLKIINLLHPTPAVCGVPKQKAKDFILENENYNRQFYTGFLGELNYANTSSLFVNLRCMQVLKNKIEIYIGGGITVASNPNSEWEETVVKTKVMKNVL